MKRFGPGYHKFKRLSAAAAAAESPEDEAIRSLNLRWTYARHHAFIEVFRNTSYGKGLFTASGGSIGLAPVSVIEGDAVCISFGCDQPGILRPAGDKWIFVALAYLHILMDVSMDHQPQACDKTLT